MLCFTISLRSQNSTNQWDQVVSDFNHTLHSVFNQTCGDFRVYVGCNEIPTLYEEYDERLIFVPVKLPTPLTWEERCRDRSWKLLACACEIKKDFDALAVHGGGVFVFPVDADDFIHCEIAQYVHDNPNANGFKSATGYRWIKGSHILHISPYYGGTMNIMKMYRNDLPDVLPDSSLCFQKETALQLTQRYPIRWYDIEVEKKFAALGKPLSPLPFRSTIYVLGTGSNISSDDPSVSICKTRRPHPVAFLRKINPFDKRFLTQSIRKTYGLVF